MACCVMEVRDLRMKFGSILTGLSPHSQITDKEAAWFTTWMMPAQKKLPGYHRTGAGFRPISRTWEMQSGKEIRNK